MELVRASQWRGYERERGERGLLILGFDLTGGAAMSLVAGYWPATGHPEAMAYFPAEPDLATLEAADAVDGVYRAMHTGSGFAGSGIGRHVRSI